MGGETLVVRAIEYHGMLETANDFWSGDRVQEFLFIYYCRIFVFIRKTSGRNHNHIGGICELWHVCDMLSKIPK